MNIVTNRTVNRRLARAAALCIVALATMALHSREARAQWTTSGNNINNTNPGSVGIGTADPSTGGTVGSKFTIASPDDNGTAFAISNGTLPRFALNNRGNGSWTMFDYTGNRWNSGITQESGNVGIGTVSPIARLDVMGAANVWGGTRYAVNNNFMASGSLTVGNISADFGGGSGWTGNTAGLMLETVNNTEIAVHDAGERVASLMYFEGGATNRVTIGRNMGWGALGSLSINGNVGLGTAAPAVKLAVNGTGTNVYNTDAWIENNLHTQGNEPLSQGGGRGRMRVGTAWGYVGLYAEPSSAAANNDLVFGASSGMVRIGPGGSTSQSLIVPNGNVGVGTGTPAHRLDVQGGAVNASGGLCIAGDCKTSWSQVGGGGQWTTSGSSLLYGSGNVGIGTTSAAARLDVMGAANVWSGNRFAVANNFMAPGSLTVGSISTNFGGGSNWTANTAGLMLETADNTEIVVHDSGQRLASLMYFEGGAANRVTIGRNMGWGTLSTVSMNGRVGIGTATPTEALEVVGNITVTGNINAKYQDVAEWVPSKQRLAAGTVVVLDTAETNHVLASNKSYDTGVAGVISAQPGLSLGEKGEDKVLVATTGRVKVRVDATRGAIRVGDLLVTSDVEGVAMKSQPLELGGVPIHRPGTLIGKALEPLAGGIGEILVLLSLQ